jgi:hypothetical protein
MPIKGTFTGAADISIKALVDVQVRTLLLGPDAPAEAPTPTAPAPVRAPITQS